MIKVNIALDIFGVLISIILLVCVIYEKYLSKTKDSNFILLTISIILLLLSDSFVWYFDKDVAHPNLIYFFNSINFIFAYLALYFFMRYLSEWFFDYNGSYRKILNIYGVLLVLSILLVVSNLFTGWLFYVDPVNGYTRGKYFLLLQIYPLQCIAGSIIFIFCYKGLSKIGRIMFTLFPVFPFLGLIIDFSLGNTAFSYLGILFSLIILFGYVYMNKTHKLGEQKNHLITSQIKPHFMYNTLTSIASLCDIDPERAKDVTINFSAYLRKNLDSLSIKGPISFSSELEHVNAYLIIEKTRFGDRVNYVYDIKAYDFRLPALSLQPLVENAVKHGICQKKKGGTVKISSYENKNYYVIVVEDDGVGFDMEKPKNDGKVHVGIKSVRDRIKYYCRGSVFVESEVGVGSKITITIPKNSGGVNE